MDVYYLPLTNMRIARTFCFTNNGQALYLVSPTEIQRLTYSQETCENLQVSNKNITIVSSRVKYSLRAFIIYLTLTGMYIWACVGTSKAFIKTFRAHVIKRLHQALVIRGTSSHWAIFFFCCDGKDIYEMLHMFYIYSLHRINIYYTYAPKKVLFK